MRSIPNFGQHLAIGILICISSGVLGCGPNVSWTPVHPNPPPMSSRQTSSVEMIQGEKPKYRFLQVGVFEFEGKVKDLSSSRTFAINRMRVLGARKGCDAVVVEDLSPVPAPDERRPVVKITGSCILWDRTPKKAEPLDGGVDATSIPVLGCSKDTDCKGDRICSDGECVFAPRLPHEGQACNGSECPAGMTCRQGRCASEGSAVDAG